VEITGPDRQEDDHQRAHSGAKVWLADFEDANTPLWDNMITGQLNLKDALDGDRPSLATRASPTSCGRRRARPRSSSGPRGWHLDEKHLLVDGQPSLRQPVRLRAVLLPLRAAQLDAGAGPYFYLAKMESHWRRVSGTTPSSCPGSGRHPRGTIRATVLIETIPAAFEMDEILYELREHSAGLNAGRWDYLFSIIKKFRNQGPRLRPAGAQRVTMALTVMAAPFMRLRRPAGQDLP